MDITKSMLTQELIDAGFTVIETDNIVILYYHGESANFYSAGVKAKLIQSDAEIYLKDIGAEVKGR